MNILVTGGAGYIGSHVVKLLGETTNHSVTVLDNLSTGRREAVLYGALEVLDLSAFNGVESLLAARQFDAVIHFAASIVVPESVENPLKYYLNNTVNTTHLIHACIRHGVQRFIFSSTAAVYGEPEQVPVAETTPPAPINPYGTSKMMSEIVLADAGLAHPDFKYIILRYFNVAGASLDNTIGQSFPNATHLIKVAAETAVGRRHSMQIFGTDYKTPDGTCIRDYIHVQDLASAHLAALDYLETGSSDIFNCGYGHGFSVREVIETMRRISGVNFAAEERGRRAGDPASLISDNRKIIRTLKWKPQYDDISLICRTALAWEQKLAGR